MKALKMSTMMIFPVLSAAWVTAGPVAPVTPMGSAMQKGAASEATLWRNSSDRAVTVVFPKGSAAIGETESAKLTNLVRVIGSDNIDRIEVAVWADKEFPKTGAELAKSDRDLAELRAAKIKEALKEGTSVSAMKIKVFNMAETSNWLARAVRTRDAELKSIFAKDANAPIERDDYNYIVQTGAPSRAVIVIVRK